MGIKVILLLSVIAHRCSTNFTDYDFFTVFGKINCSSDCLYDDFFTVFGKTNCSSNTDCQYEDYLKKRFGNISCSPFPECLFPQIGSFLVMEDCNSTLDQEEFNCSLSISNESAGFLKGLMFTRLMPSFYILIILISLPLNALALVMFTCRIREKKPAVIYMCHLACVDLLFTLLLPLKIHYQLNASDWVFGEVACRVLTAAYYCYMYCSILLMMCMSVDRLLAVALPITTRTWRSVRKASCICVLVWLLALAGTVPLLSMTQTAKIKNVGVTCHDALQHNDPTDQLYLYLFFILSCFYFFLPLVITLVSYSTIIYVLRVKSGVLATSSSSSSSSDNRRRAVIMAIAVLIEFVVCFAPTNGILLYHCIRLATGGNSGEGDSSYAAYLLAVCLGSASVFLDPFLYYYGSSQCRQKIQSVLRKGKPERPTTPYNTAVTKTKLTV